MSEATPPKPAEASPSAAVATPAAAVATPAAAAAGTVSPAPAVAGAKPANSYRVQDEELLLDFYKKLFWNRLVPHIPASITPNTLTIVGQLCALFSVVATAVAFAGTPIFNLVSAFLLMAYLTFDNIDGAHARRTKQTSTLGEFLDHGLDGLASTAILIVSGMVLTIEGSWLVLLCALGAFGFAALFWEQFRTGLLVIPRFSSTEGVTILFIYQVLRFFFGKPTWLQFSTDHITAGTIIVALVFLAYIGAAIPSMRRAAKLGVASWELAPLFVLMAAQPAFSYFGANYFVPAATVGLIGANVTCRLILLRHRGQTGPFLAPVLWLTVLPLAMPAIAPNLWTATGWALVSLAIAAIDYGRNLWFGGSELVGRSRQASTA